MEFNVIVEPILAPAWDKEKVKEAVASKLVEYENAVYTVDTIQTAKADRAELNKIAKAIDDERKRIKAIYNAPYLTFEKEVKEITGLIDKTVSAIDSQVKAFEQKAKEEKLATVKTMYAERNMNGVPFETVFNEKWLNATTSLSAIGKEMDKLSEDISADMSVLATIGEYQFEAVEEYRKTRSLADAMRKSNELKEQAKRKAEFEALGTPLVVPQEKPSNELQEVVLGDDGLPDFDTMGDGRYPIIIKAKVTKKEEADITFFIKAMGVEFEIIGG